MDGTNESKLNKTFIGVFVRRIIIAASNTVFNRGVIGHRKISPNRGNPLGLGLAQLTRKGNVDGQVLLDGKRPDAAKATDWRSATILTLKSSIASLNNL